jgi:glycosyltransferase involved in cell wall biosynthesis
VGAGVPTSRIRVIHPVPPDDGAAVSRRPAAPRLLAIGQLVRGKGFDIAVDALAHLPRDVTLTIAGDGPDRDEIRRRAARVVPGRVDLLGYVAPASLSTVYDAASVVVVPSRWPEPFGMVGIEAMRRGRPVAGAAHGGIPEWLEDGAAGRLFAPGDPSALGAAVGALLADAAAGERARAFVHERFSHERMVGEVEDLLEEIATRSQDETRSHPAMACRFETAAVTGGPGRPR